MQKTTTGERLARLEAQHEELVRVISDNSEQVKVLTDKLVALEINTAKWWFGMVLVGSFLGALGSKALDYLKQL